MTVLERLRRHHAILGIGFGPSNIALAVAIEEANADLDVHFIEAAPDATWQIGMLLGGSDIQNNPVRDLVTPRNPRSRYTFINYLKESDRLFDFLNLGIIYPLRKDYSKYIEWVASHFGHMVSYRTAALSVTIDHATLQWRVETNMGVFTANALIFATGRSRNIPPPFVPHLGPRIFHMCDYLPRIKELAPTLSSIAVVGSSQSAVELNIDLMNRFSGLEIHAIHRAYSMRQKDTSPFSDHVYFPEFVDYFFAAGRDGRRELERQLRTTNYNSADIDVLHQLYLKIYEERLDDHRRFHLHKSCVVDGVSADGAGVSLDLRDRFFHNSESIRVDAVVLATGFLDIGAGDGKELFPPLLAEVSSELARTEDGALLVERNYRVRSRTGLPLFLNGMCESSHGLGDAGSFSLLALRATEILRGLERYASGDFAVRAPRELAIRQSA
jgi:L-ornithine N5-oxygenase